MDKSGSMADLRVISTGGGNVGIKSVIWDGESSRSGMDVYNPGYGLTGRLRIHLRCSEQREGHTFKFELRGYPELSRRFYENFDPTDPDWVYIAASLALIDNRRENGRGL